MFPSDAKLVKFVGGGNLSAGLRKIIEFFKKNNPDLDDGRD